MKKYIFCTLLICLNASMAMDWDDEGRPMDDSYVEECTSPTSPKGIHKKDMRFSMMGDGRVRVRGGNKKSYEQYINAIMKKAAQVITQRIRNQRS